MKNKKNEIQNRLNFLLGIVVIALPFLLGNVPYLNLLFLGVEQKVTYFWIAALIVFRLQTRFLVYLLVFLLIAHFFILIYYNSFGVEILSNILYFSLVYLFIKLVKQL